MQGERKPSAMDWVGLPLNKLPMIVVAMAMAPIALSPTPIIAGRRAVIAWPSIIENGTLHIPVAVDVNGIRGLSLIHI